MITKNAPEGALPCHLQTGVHCGKVLMSRQRGYYSRFKPPRQPDRFLAGFSSVKKVTRTHAATGTAEITGKKKWEQPLPIGLPTIRHLYGCPDACVQNPGQLVSTQEQGGNLSPAKGNRLLESGIEQGTNHLQPRWAGPSQGRRDERV